MPIYGLFLSCECLFQSPNTRLTSVARLRKAPSRSQAPSGRSAAWRARIERSSQCNRSSRSGSPQPVKTIPQHPNDGTCQIFCLILMPCTSLMCIR